MNLLMRVYDAGLELLMKRLIREWRAPLVWLMIGRGSNLGLITHSCAILSG